MPAMNDPGAVRPSATPEPQAGAESTSSDDVAVIRCDFCGQVVERVRRIALDRGYERLQTPHLVQYACSTCSEAKERKRLR